MSDGSDQAFAARLKAYEGRPAVVAGAGKDPVNAPMIRHWCEAMGDNNPAYTGPDAIAPPTMLQTWTMGGLSGHTGHTGHTEAFDELLGLLDEAGCTSVVATDCEQEYVRPLRPGEEITFDSVIESVSGRKQTKLGTGYFVTTRMEVRADGEPAGTHRFRILKYAPAQKNPVGQRPGDRPAGKSPAARKPSDRPAAGKVSGRPAGQSAGNKPAPRRPRPVVNRDNAGFWEGVTRHRLLIQRCAGCGTLRFPWLPGCNACGSPKWYPVEACGEGTVYSYVVTHHPLFPAFSTSDRAADAAGPYAVSLIELAEGVRIISNVIGVPYDKVRIGLPVRLAFVRYDEELELPVFRANDGHEGGGTE